MTRIRHTGRVVALCVAFSVVSPSMTLAQGPGTRQPVEHRHVVSANPFLLLAGWFNAEYERKLVETWTVAVSGSYVSFGDPDDVYVSGNAVFRYYPQGAALTGFYIGPRPPSGSSTSMNSTIPGRRLVWVSSSATPGSLGRSDTSASVWGPVGRG